MTAQPPNPALEDRTLWYQDAVIYQLHVKSFFDSNDDGIGDFAGLIAKLDYLVELGVDTIWLLPFYPSPRRDDGYDIADYRGVHPDYGTLADFRRFVATAHSRGLRVITELVINHTSDKHPWFQRARRAKPGSVARNYYVWSDTDQAYKGTRIIFLDTEKSNWTWDEEAQAYFWHRFYSHQPDLNFDNPHVLKEVLAVMRFWLDLGVDGLRLDAVPYLVEREGTSNENLPETHAILKAIRAHLDASYTDRMLLAEANQWPEDAQEYFGKGDECHMAFHFPLMPRMYMAIAREDRFPITDILRQTPAIPSNCQWAIFLRNHDELTLEMVTSAERDYLWETYAVDRRARLNLGIRRRLAPLLERDRRRIELMNSLLLSMPGTPIIYYGDEIGMGDNIHQGDRDGVRTPMQWSPDRNGGFSRSDPESLVLPPIMSPLYGFQAVNVETQARDPHSILNWTRRMLALRRQHRAFGRGSLRFLYPGNNKILAYLRESRDELVLCVANLSRAPQAVELDLSQYAGRVPVELMGGSSFPAIGELTYLLTLPPYGFFWFLLSTEAQPPAWHTAAPTQVLDQITLVLHNRLSYELTSSSREILRAEVLPPYLARRRWFASKGEPLKGIRFAYAVGLPDHDNVFLTELEVEFANRTERYQLPASVVWENSVLTTLAQQLSLARVRRGAQMGTLTDAFALEDFAYSVLSAWRHGLELPTAEGLIRFIPEDGLSAVQEDKPPVRWLTAEQSNSSLILGETAVLKLVRRVSPGIHPEAEMTRHLTRAGFTNTAVLLGEALRTDAKGVPHTLLLLQRFITNQGDGWVWTLDYLDRTIEDAALTGETGVEHEEEMTPYENFAAAIGRRLGELHALLALPSDDAAFAPERAERSDVEQWTTEIKDMLQGALDVIAVARDWKTPALARGAEYLLQNRARLMETIERLAAHGEGTLKTRIHGDFHLGQVLVAQSDAYLIDFEGEPAVSLDRRRRKTSPLRDVAGLLRSFDYAAATVGEAGREGAVAALPTVQARREDLLQRFRARSAGAFLKSYALVAHDTPHPWTSPESEAALLDLFLIEKAAYEVRYEAANRPDWIGLPIRGLCGIARHLLDETDEPDPFAAQSEQPVPEDPAAGDDHG
ncbi:MAG: maltose alpha-D-glucosyltransferase [Burkholderiaceae bacterium]|jgi:maltose alpha-D-glucosyltransferase/alpha-amylase